MSAANVKTSAVLYCAEPSQTGAASLGAHSPRGTSGQKPLIAEVSPLPFALGGSRNGAGRRLGLWDVWGSGRRTPTLFASLRPHWAEPYSGTRMVAIAYTRAGALGPAGWDSEVGLQLRGLGFPVWSSLEAACRHAAGLGEDTPVEQESRGSANPAVVPVASDRGPPAPTSACVAAARLAAAAPPAACFRPLAPWPAGGGPTGRSENSSPVRSPIPVLPARGSLAWQNPRPAARDSAVSSSAPTPLMFRDPPACPHAQGATQPAGRALAALAPPRDPALPLFATAPSDRRPRLPRL